MFFSVQYFLCDCNEQRYAIAFKWLGEVQFCFSWRNLPDIQYFKHTDITKLMKTFVFLKQVAFFVDLLICFLGCLAMISIILYILMCKY